MQGREEQLERQLRLGRQQLQAMVLGEVMEKLEVDVSEV
jgi:hypothetical protein